MLLEIAVEFDPTNCAECGCQFALTRTMMQELRKTGKGFHCPNGHSLTFGEGENERLRKKNAQLLQRIDQKDAEIKDERKRHEKTEHRLRGTKAALTRTKNSVAEGKCPCCGKKFEDLLGHMTEVHPDYVPATEQEEVPE